MVKKEDPKLNAYLNRGRVIVDDEEHIYYIFRTLPDPTVRKYRLDGKLLLELHPRGTELSQLMAEARVKIRESIKRGRISLVGTLNAVQINSITGDIWIAPSGPILYVYSAQGRKLAEYRVRDTSGRIHGVIDFTLVGGARGVFVNPAGCFLFDLPKGR